MVQIILKNIPEIEYQITRFEDNHGSLEVEKISIWCGNE